jgi:ATP-dependent RNA helicase DeaD
LTSESETPATEAPPSTKRAHLSDRRFADFPLSPEILKGILEYGFEYATPVQAAAIEPALAGKDLLVRAKTGTGKTAAFGIPMAERIEDGERKPRGLVLAPVRELAQQIAEEIGGIIAYRDLKIAVLVGGIAMGPQEQALAEGAEIIIGTPGRVLDFVRRGNLDLSGVRVACLDEADEMLSMGFYEDVTRILDKCPSDRQVLLFSATIDQDTERLIQRYTTEPEDIYLSQDGDHVEGITHVLYETSPALHKARALLYLLDLEDPDSAIIFCNTREDTATVAAYLDRQGLDVQILSGELPQSQRSKVMKKVKDGEVKFLVSTDVAARGIDISDLSHVVNYSLPQDAAVYMHRVGRTGRIGKKGMAISLVGGPDMGTRTTLEKVKKVKFEVRALPNPEDAVARRVARQATRIREVMGTMAFEAYLPTVQALKNQEGGDALLAAALRAFFQWDRTRRAATSSVDSLGALEESRREERREKSDRGPRRRDGDRREGREDRREGRETRGRSDDRRDSRGRDDRRDDRPRAPKKPVSTSDLDDLLVSDDTPAAASTDADDTLLVADDTTEAAAPGDAAKKKRRRRRRKGGKGAGAEGSDASETDVDDVLEVSEAPAGADDLDALLSAE